MKDLDPNVTAGLIGGTGAILKGMKRRHKLRTTIINTITGGMLAYLSLDVIPLIVEDASERTIMLISFTIGYVSNELTDHFEELLDTVFDVIKAKINIKK